MDKRIKNVAPATHFTMRSFWPRLTGRLRVKQRMCAKRIEYSSKRSSDSLRSRTRRYATRHWPNWDESRTLSLYNATSFRLALVPRIISRPVHSRRFCLRNLRVSLRKWRYRKSCLRELSVTNSMQWTSNEIIDENIVVSTAKKHFFYSTCIYIFQGPVDRPAFFNENRGMFHNTYNWNESRDCFMLG